MSHVTTRGASLCGAVCYEASGEAHRFYHCHCSRCREVTGTGHASILLATRLESIHWTARESMLRRYKIPEAKRFRNCFCSQCGSPVPRRITELDAVLIPAGLLDVPVLIMLSARIFTLSREAWSCKDDGLPVHDEYPDDRA